MSRRVIDGDTAFEMLREHSQHNGRKVAAVARAIVESHQPLVPLPQQLSHLRARADGKTAAEPPEPAI